MTEQCFLAYFIIIFSYFLSISLSLSPSLSSPLSPLSSSLSSLLYPEFRVSPITTVREKSNHFAVTGFSVTNQKDHLWWRWFMPSFSEEHLNPLNITVNDNINEKFLCHLRFIGMMSPAHQLYDRGGTGQLEFLSVRLKCYYLVYFQYSGSHRVAVYCPVLNPLFNISNTNTSERVIPTKSGKTEITPEELCHQFLTVKSFQGNVTLFPSPYPVKIRKFPKDHVNIPPFDSSSLTSLFHVTAKSIPSPKDFSSRIITVRDKERQDFVSPISFSNSAASFHSSSHRIVITVQVFSNLASSAHLHLFLQHYSRLDFTIVLYDRFGLHFDLVQQYIGKEGYDIRYHPYTLLQIVFPDIYTEKYKASINRNYTFYYEYDKIDKTDNITSYHLSDTLILDLDKQFTFDTARLEYQHSSSLLFVDIDELLFSLPHPTKIKETIETYYNPRQNDAENWKISRINLAGNTSTNTLSTSKRSDKNLIPVIEKCLQNGMNSSLTLFHSHRQHSHSTPFHSSHTSRSLSLSSHSIVSLLSCYSGPPYPQSFPKYIDTLSVCPFSWNHGSCFDFFNVRGIWTPQQLSKKYHDSLQPDCVCKAKRITNALQLIHLSHQGYMKSVGRAMQLAHVSHLSINQTQNPLLGMWV